MSSFLSPSKRITIWKIGAPIFFINSFIVISGGSVFFKMAYLTTIRLFNTPDVWTFAATLLLYAATALGVFFYTLWMAEFAANKTAAAACLFWHLLFALIKYATSTYSFMWDKDMVSVPVCIGLDVYLTLIFILAFLPSRKKPSVPTHI